MIPFQSNKDNYDDNEGMSFGKQNRQIIKQDENKNEVSVNKQVVR